METIALRMNFILSRAHDNIVELENLTRIIYKQQYKANFQGHLGKMNRIQNMNIVLQDAILGLKNSNTRLEHIIRETNRYMIHKTYYKHDIIETDTQSNSSDYDILY